MLAELNLKEIQFLKDGADLVVESVKPNLKRLGARLGKKLPLVQNELKSWGTKEIRAFEQNRSATVAEEVLEKEDLLIDRKAAEGKCAGALEGLVAELDTALTPELRREGLLREMINRIQQRRKEMRLKLTDRIVVKYAAGGECLDILTNEKAHATALSNETLAKSWIELYEQDAVKEAFEDHGDAWLAFRIEAV